MVCIICCWLSCSFLFISISCWRISISAVDFSWRKSTKGSAHLLFLFFFGCSPSAPSDNFLAFVWPIVSSAFCLTSSFSFKAVVESWQPFSSLSINSSISVSFSGSSTQIPLADSSSLTFPLYFRLSNCQRSRTARLSFIRNWGVWIALRFSTMDSHSSPRLTVPFLKVNNSPASISLSIKTSWASVHSIDGLIIKRSRESTENTKLQLLLHPIITAKLCFPGSRTPNKK